MKWACFGKQNRRNVILKRSDDFIFRKSYFGNDIGVVIVKVDIY